MGLHCHRPYLRRRLSVCPKKAFNLRTARKEAGVFSRPHSIHLRCLLSLVQVVVIELYHLASRLSNAMLPRSSSQVVTHHQLIFIFLLLLSNSTDKNNHFAFLYKRAVSATSFSVPLESTGTCLCTFRCPHTCNARSTDSIVLR